jgi:type I restriction enzyme S subunit
VGVNLSGFQYVKLKDVGYTYGGLTGKSGSDFVDGDTPFVTFLNVINNIVARPNLIGYVKVFKDEVQNIVLENDLLFNGSSETAEEVAFPSLVPASLSGSLLNSFCFGFRFTDLKLIDPLYFAYLLRSPIGRPEISKLAQGSTRINISKAALLDLEWFLPPIGEQNAIAAVLSELDELIDTLKLEIEKTGNLLTATIQELFPPNFTKGNLPEGWRLKNLADLGTVSGGGVDKIARIGDIPIKLLNYMDVHRNTFITPSINFMETTATKDQVQNCSIQEGDIIFTPTSETPEDIARSSVVSSNFLETCYSYHLVRFRPKVKLDANFMAYVFLLEDFRMQALKAAEGSGTRYVITLPRFRSLLIPVPEAKTQIKIGQTINSIATQIENLKALREKYEKIKAGVANDLLTGRVRLT